MHFGVDAAVAFLVMFLVALLAGYPLIVVAVIAVVIGAAVAPFTRRAEERALAEREHARPVTDGPTSDGAAS